VNAQSGVGTPVSPEQRVAVVIPAKNESGRIASTVASAKTIPLVDLVLVVDDGSGDQTRKRAQEAGAVVVRHSHNRGKAEAMETGAAVIAMRDVDGAPARLLLFLDADLGETAQAAAPLIGPVAGGEADFSIAVLPPQVGAAGFGAVVRLARRGIAKATGLNARAPLSGQRCLSREAYEAATPLARGWGVEVGMTIDLLRQGFTAVEVECELRHRPSGKSMRGLAHRLAQYRDVSLALAARGVRIALGTAWRRAKRAARRGRPPTRPSGPHLGGNSVGAGALETSRRIALQVDQACTQRRSEGTGQA
jgi:hypothetical protein